MCLICPLRLAFDAIAIARFLLVRLDALFFFVPDTLVDPLVLPPPPRVIDFFPIARCVRDVTAAAAGVSSRVGSSMVKECLCLNPGISERMCVCACICLCECVRYWRVLVLLIEYRASLAASVECMRNASTASHRDAIRYALLRGTQYGTIQSTGTS